MRNQTASQIFVEKSPDVTNRNTRTNVDLVGSIFANDMEIDIDDHNEQKILNKHGISRVQIREALADDNLFVRPTYSGNDPFRTLAIGCYGPDLYLTVVFTVRNGKTRPISARPASRKERKDYHNR